MLPSPPSHADEAKTAKTEFISLAWGGCKCAPCCMHVGHIHLFMLMFKGRGVFLQMWVHALHRVCVWISWCCSGLFFFGGLSNLEFALSLAVCRAVPVRLPYNTAWLTSQQQTAAAFIRYYTGFSPNFSAVAGKHSKETAVTTSKKKKKMWKCPVDSK